MRDSRHSATSSKPYDRPKQGMRVDGDAESTIGSLRRSLKQALHSFWDDASPRRPKVQHFPKRTQPIYKKDNPPKTDMGTEIFAQKEPKVPFQWKDDKPPQAFDNMPLPAHLVISAYREAIMNDPKRRSISPPPQERPTKQLKQQKQAKPSELASPPPKSPAPVQAPRRIELVSKPIVDLSQLPAERKSRPGFISVDFDVSDEEPSVPTSDQPSQTVLRRPSKENDRLIKYRESTAESASEKPLFKFSSREQQPTGEAPRSLPQTTPFSFNKDIDPSKKADLGGSAGTSGNSVTDAPGSAPKAAFSFKPPVSAQQESTAESDVTKENGPFQFSFGQKSQDLAPPENSQEKPLFSFGKGNNSSEAPKFSFGSSNQVSDKPADSQPANSKPFNFSFGASQNVNAPEKESKQPAFSFMTSNDARSSANPDETKEASSNGSNSFPKLGSTTSAVLAKPTETKDDEPSTGKKDIGLFTSNNEGKPSDKPFVFGSSVSNPSQPLFNPGGAPSEPALKEPPKPIFAPAAPFAANSEKPAFSFSASGSTANESSGPKFSFGSSAENGKSDQGPTGNSSSNPPLSFGATLAKPDAPKSGGSTTSESTKSASEGLAGTKSNSASAFTFGNNASNVFAKPSDTSNHPFNFGSSSTGTTEAPSTASSTIPKAPTSGFNFAFGANSVSGSNFGKTDTLPFGSNSNSAASSRDATPVVAPAPAPASQANPVGFNFGSAGQPAPAPSQPQQPGSMGFNFNFGAPPAPSSNPVAGRPLARPRRRLPVRR